MDWIVVVMVQGIFQVSLRRLLRCADLFLRLSTLIAHVPSMGPADTESMRPVSLLDSSSDTHRSPRHPLPQILRLLALYKRTMSIVRTEVPPRMQVCL
jgi:hypothetical protein